jgi:CheY-like chemotaxis protein
MTSQPPVMILLIDNEPSFTSALATLLRRDGYTIDITENGRLALTQLQAHRYDLFLCDLLMPELGGEDFYDVLRQQYPALCQRVIFLTGDTMHGESLAFLEACGQPWLKKPCGAAAVREAVQQLFDKTGVNPGPDPDDAEPLM